MDLDPTRLLCENDPHPAYARLREEQPVHYVAERDLWVLSRYDDVRAAVRDPATWSSAEGVVPSGFKPDKPTLIVSDPPGHTTLRKAVTRAFTPRRIAAIEPRIRELARGLTEALPRGADVDAFERFTDPLPMLVLAELLGVDPGQHEMFKRCGDVIVYATESDADALHAAQTELTEYLAEVFAERRARPRNDLISVLLTESPEGRALSEDELLGLCFLLLVAGTETTTSGLGNALLLLDEHRDARKALIAEPDTIEAAVEEILRFESPVHGLSRVLTRDVRLHGRAIPKGARVHLLYAAANRDPRVFDAPDRFDITRSPNHHLAFGLGIHFCLGASLARMELRVGLQEFLRVAPDYELDREGVTRLPSDTNRGYARIPLRT